MVPPISPEALCLYKGKMPPGTATQLVGLFLFPRVVQTLVVVTEPHGPDSELSNFYHFDHVALYYSAHYHNI